MLYQSYKTTIAGTSDVNRPPRGTRSSRNPAHLSRKPAGSEQSSSEHYTEQHYVISVNINYGYCASSYNIRNIVWAGVLILSFVLTMARQLKH